MRDRIDSVLATNTAHVFIGRLFDGLGFGLIIVALALALALGGCATGPARAYGPVPSAEPVVYTTDAEWSTCDVDCRINVAREVCPAMPSIPPAMRVHFVEFGSRAELEATLARQPECRRSVAHRPVVLASSTSALTEVEQQKLDELLEKKAIQVFGEPKNPGRHNFRGVERKFQPVPAGCTERRQRVGQGTMIRVICP